MQGLSLTRIGRLCVEFVLSSESYLELLVNYKKIILSNESMKFNAEKFYHTELLSAFKRSIHGLPPHQIEAQHPFGHSLVPVKVLTSALQLLPDYYLEWVGKPGFRMDRLLEFGDLSQRIMVVQMLAGLRAQQRLSGLIGKAGVLPPDTMPMIPQSSLEIIFRRGLAELHQHYNASCHPTDIWMQAMGNPLALVKTKYEYDADKEYFPRDWCRYDLYVHVQQAKWVRRLIARAIEAIDPALYPVTGPQRLQSVLTGLFTLVDDIRYKYKGSQWSDIRPTGALPLDPGSPFENELYFLTESIVNLEGLVARNIELNGFKLVFAFHYYLLIQNLFMQNYVQQDWHIGFESFSRFERGGGLQAYRNRKGREAMDDYLRNHRLKNIELRFVPQTTHVDYVKLSETFKEALDEESKGLSKLKWGFIFHLVKAPDKDERASGFIRVARHHRVRHNTYFALRALLRSRTAFPGLASHYLALDAANDERFAGPEVFAPHFRLFRDRFALPIRSSKKGDNSSTKPLAITFHAGESFEHPLSGIRYVDESIEFLDMRPGDRIGHGLALGINIAQWHQVMGDEVFLASKGQWLDNLLWMKTVAMGNGFPASVLNFLQDQIPRLAQECYCNLLIDYRGDLRQTHNLLSARKFRRLEPSRALRVLEPILQREYDQLVKKYPEASVLWNHYHFCDECRKKYGKAYQIERELLPPKSDWFGALQSCQEFVLDKLYKRDISIEANPTSNLRISSIGRMSEHPIFRWFPVKETERQAMPKVTVNGDNYCVFQTTLPLEYAYLAMAALERGHTMREIESWLELLRQNGFDCSFIV